MFRYSSILKREPCIAVLQICFSFLFNFRIFHFSNFIFFEFFECCPFCPIFNSLNFQFWPFHPNYIFVQFTIWSRAEVFNLVWFSTPFEVFIECTVKTLRCLSIASYHNFAPRQACIFSRSATKKLVSQVFGGCPKISFSCQSNAQTSVMIPKEQKKSFTWTEKRYREGEGFFPSKH